MKLISVITPLVALFSVASAVNVHHDATYDNAAGLLSTVTGTCSNGANIFSKYKYFSSLKSYPYVGAANGLECGSCWRILYLGNAIYVTVVSQTVKDGFNLSLKAVDDLINGSKDLVQDAHSMEVDKSICGL